MSQAVREPQTKTQTNNDNFSFQDIIATKQRGGRELALTKAYDPTVFWDEIAEHFYHSFKDVRQFQANIAWLIDRFKVLKPESLLDVGAGFARVEPFLIQAEVIKNITALDSSANALTFANEYLSPVADGVDENKDAELAKVQNTDFTKSVDLLQGDIRHLDIPSGSFDCVLCVEVLQHFEKEDCLTALREIIRVSKRYVILQERWAFPGEHSEPHIWSHDLSAMCDAMGVTVLQNAGITSNMQGLVIMKR